MFDDDIIDKKTLIIKGANTSNIILSDIEPIHNVLAIKHVLTYATIDANGTTPDIKNIIIKISDFNLKTIISNNKTNLIFNNLIFKNNEQYVFKHNQHNYTGIIHDFRIDPDNYVCNPILNKLDKLDISFYELDETNGNLVPYELKEVNIELCIYSNRKKLTMI
jgi:hypothetical protein|tara:strand:+ start:266 stop:757 length:492 start_codon:yes stop_codon:yes gene_type:complete